MTHFLHPYTWGAFMNTNRQFLRCSRHTKSGTNPAGAPNYRAYRPPFLNLVLRLLSKKKDVSVMSLFRDFGGKIHAPVQAVFARNYVGNTARYIPLSCHLIVTLTNQNKMGLLSVYMTVPNADRSAAEDLSIVNLIADIAITRSKYSALQKLVGRFPELMSAVVGTLPYIHYNPFPRTRTLLSPYVCGEHIPQLLYNKWFGLAWLALSRGLVLTPDPNHCINHDYIIQRYELNGTWYRLLKVSGTSRSEFVEAFIISPINALKEFNAFVYTWPHPADRSSFPTNYFRASKSLKVHIFDRYSSAGSYRGSINPTTVHLVDSKVLK